MTLSFISVLQRTVDVECIWNNKTNSYVMFQLNLWFLIFVQFLFLCIGLNYERNIMNGATCVNGLCYVILPSEVWTCIKNHIKKILKKAGMVINLPHVQQKNMSAASIAGFVL